MNLSAYEEVAVSLVRRALSIEGDSVSDVAFQNDIDVLLARIEEMRVPFRSLAGLTSFSVGWLEKAAPSVSLRTPSAISPPRSPLRWVA